jgi:hypothetical protein
VINKAPKNSAVWRAAGNDERKRENSGSQATSAPAFALFGEVKLRVVWLFVLATTQTKVVVVEASEFFKNYETITNI